eukprot:6191927-Pleurochrysis_carterae.AAC.1
MPMARHAPNAEGGAASPIPLHPVLCAAMLCYAGGRAAAPRCAAIQYVSILTYYNSDIYKVIYLPQYNCANPRARLRRPRARLSGGSDREGPASDGVRFPRFLTKA